MGENITFTDNSIILLSGEENPAFPKAERREALKSSNGFQLDESGEFLWARDKEKSDKAQKGDEISPELKRTRELFKRNAVELYRHRDEICADSRMFLASVDMDCNLAYTGTSGLEWVTLGVWIEWWNELEQCRSGKDGNERMVVYIAGSPLSGQNSCTAVNERGEESRVSFGEFKPLWKTFAEVNKRYFEAAQRFESYSLEKVLQRLGII